MPPVDIHSTVVETVPLAQQWPTLDPFLFCVHHDDRYPAGNDQLGPAASLEGRTLGNDFAGLDGWRMYHGRTVPGFPAHPHRGFETVTFARNGHIDHSDSLGAAARFGRGDVQWMTAGAGIVHSEMFPLLDADQPNHVELFQIWLNLPAADKLVAPHFAIFWDETIPRHRATSPQGSTTTVTTIAGTVGDAVAPPPPPSSWAADHDHDVAIWHITMEPGAAWTLPPARHLETVRTLYVFSGEGVRLDSTAVGADVAAVTRCDRPVEIVNDHDATAEILVLQGRPIAEPVAQHGPFVMNHQHEIRQAILDYQRSSFGGWPWPTDDPTHPRDQGRFARHADGHVHEPH